MHEDFDNFKPIDLLELCKEIYSNIDHYNNKSALKRIIYSRTYYSVFLLIREWLIKNKGYNSMHDHRNIPKVLYKKGPYDFSRNKEIHDNFLILKQLRIQADYYMKIPNKNSSDYEKWIFEDVDFALEIAEDIFDSFKDV